MWTPAQLRDELEFYRSRRDFLIKAHPGEFALIKGRTLVGSYPSQERAFEQGVRRFQSSPFLVVHLAHGNERALAPGLVPIAGARPASSPGVPVPPPSWRRGRFVENPIIEVDLQLPE